MTCFRRGFEIFLKLITAINVSQPFCTLSLQATPGDSTIHADERISVSHQIQRNEITSKMLVFFGWFKKRSFKYIRTPIYLARSMNLFVPG